MSPSVVLNLLSSCLCLWSAGRTGVCVTNMISNLLECQRHLGVLAHRNILGQAGLLTLRSVPHAGTQPWFLKD